ARGGPGAGAAAAGGRRPDPQAVPHERTVVRGQAGAARGRRMLRGGVNAVVEWIEQAATEPAVEALPNDEVLAPCELSMDAGPQEELSGLLRRHREGNITGAEGERLAQLLAAYRRGLVRKARAWKEAVARRLKPPLSNGAT